MKTLRKKEVKEINEQVSNIYNLQSFFDKKDKVIVDDNIVTKNDEPVFFYHDKKLVPTLKLLQQEIFLPKVTVDMGAIRFVISGADIMRPGITQLDEFKKDSFICIIDETHKKPLAVAYAKDSSDTIKNMESGKVLKNIHYTGDTIYNY